MSNTKKRAYRHLLYIAMVDIRSLEHSQRPAVWNLRQIWKHHRRSQRAGALANWLHNLAASSSMGFRDFREDEFWNAYDRFQQRFLITAGIT